MNSRVSHRLKEPLEMQSTLSELEERVQIRGPGRNSRRPGFKELFQFIHGRLSVHKALEFIDDLRAYTKYLDV